MSPVAERLALRPFQKIRMDVCLEGEPLISWVRVKEVQMVKDFGRAARLRQGLPWHNAPLQEALLQR